MGHAKVRSADFSAVRCGCIIHRPKIVVLSQSGRFTDVPCRCLDYASTRKRRPFIDRSNQSLKLGKRPLLSCEAVRVGDHRDNQFHASYCGTATENLAWAKSLIAGNVDFPLFCCCFGQRRHASFYHKARIKMFRQMLEVGRVRSRCARKRNTFSNAPAVI